MQDQLNEQDALVSNAGDLREQSGFTMRRRVPARPLPGVGSDQEREARLMQSGFVGESDPIVAAPNAHANNTVETMASVGESRMNENLEVGVSTSSRVHAQSSQPVSSNAEASMPSEAAGSTLNPGAALRRPNARAMPGVGGAAPKSFAATPSAPATRVPLRSAMPSVAMRPAAAPVASPNRLASAPVSTRSVAAARETLHAELVPSSTLPVPSESNAQFLAEHAKERADAARRQRQESERVVQAEEEELAQLRTMLVQLQEERVRLEAANVQEREGVERVSRVLEAEKADRVTLMLELDRRRLDREQLEGQEIEQRDAIAQLRAQVQTAREAVEQAQQELRDEMDARDAIELEMNTTRERVMQMQARRQESLAELETAEQEATHAQAALDSAKQRKRLALEDAESEEAARTQAQARAWAARQSNQQAQEALDRELHAPRVAHPVETNPSAPSSTQALVPAPVVSERAAVAAAEPKSSYFSASPVSTPAASLGGSPSAPAAIEPVRPTLAHPLVRESAIDESSLAQSPAPVDKPVRTSRVKAIAQRLGQGGVGVAGGAVRACLEEMGETAATSFSALLGNKQARGAAFLHFVAAGIVMFLFAHWSAHNETLVMGGQQPLKALKFIATYAGSFGFWCVVWSPLGALRRAAAARWAVMRDAKAEALRERTASAVQATQVR